MATASPNRNLLKAVSTREPCRRNLEGAARRRGAPGTRLLAGGAGYIGAHVARVLRSAGHPLSFFERSLDGVAGRVGDLDLIKASRADTRKPTAARMLEHDVTGHRPPLAARSPCRVAHQAATSTTRSMWWHAAPLMEVGPFCPACPVIYSSTRSRVWDGPRSDRSPGNRTPIRLVLTRCIARRGWIVSVGWPRRTG